jgi:hypothetical protein
MSGTIEAPLCWIGMVTQQAIAADAPPSMPGYWDTMRKEIWCGCFRQSFLPPTPLNRAEIQRMIARLDEAVSYFFDRQKVQWVDPNMLDWSPPATLHPTLDSIRQRVTIKKGNPGMSRPATKALLMADGLQALLDLEGIEATPPAEQMKAMRLAVDLFQRSAILQNSGYRRAPIPLPAWVSSPFLPHDPFLLPKVIIF